MKKVWVFVFVLLSIAWLGIIFFGNKLGLSEKWLWAIQSGIWIGVAISFVCVLTANSRTDGDLVAGAEDEDGLVFALSTPVEELVQKDTVIFHVVKEKKHK